MSGRASALGDKRYPCITVLKAKGPSAARKHDRYSPGLHHLALRAKSRDDVDALYGKLTGVRRRRFSIAPADYPEYGKGYYAVFFADPDWAQARIRVHATAGRSARARRARISDDGARPPR